MKKIQLLSVLIGFVLVAFTVVVLGGTKKVPVEPAIELPPVDQTLACGVVRINSNQRGIVAIRKNGEVLILPINPAGPKLGKPHTIRLPRV